MAPNRKSPFFVDRTASEGINSFNLIIEFEGLPTYFPGAQAYSNLNGSGIRNDRKQSLTVTAELQGLKTGLRKVWFINGG